MAFDFISGTIASISLLIIVIVSILLYINMQNNKKQVTYQIQDLITQFNSGQKQIYNMTKKQQEAQEQIAKRISCLKCPSENLA